MSKPKELLPGLNPYCAWMCHYGFIHPCCSLSKKDRSVLKAAGYVWAGRWWQKFEQTKAP